MPKDAKVKNSPSPVAEMMKNAGFDSMPELGTKWLEAMTLMTSGMMAFISERIKEDTKTQADLMHAKGLPEIQHIQAQFIHKAMEDYKAEMGRLTDLGKDLVPEVLSDVFTDK